MTYREHYKALGFKEVIRDTDSIVLSNGKKTITVSKTIYEKEV